MNRGKATMLFGKKIRNKAVSFVVSAAMISGIFMPAFPALPVLAAELEQVEENPEQMAMDQNQAAEELGQIVEELEQMEEEPGQAAEEGIGQDEEEASQAAEAQEQPEAQDENAGELDLTQYDPYDAEAGNIARNATVRAAYSNGGSVATNVNNGTLSTGNTGTVWNTWGTQYGNPGNPVWVRYTWDKPQVIEATRVMWWIYVDGGVRWPRDCVMQYKKGDQWIDCGPIATNGNSENFKGEGGAEANKPWPSPNPWGRNTVWNPLVLEKPIVTSQLRLCVTAERDSGTAPGIGVSEWEVFGHFDPALADLEEIDENFLMELYGNAALPTAGTYGSAITWSNPTNTALAVNGAVTRPEIGQADATGKITATAVKDGFTASKEFNFVVKAKMSDKAMADADLAAIDLGKTEGRTSNFTLPAEGRFGSKFTWSSSNPVYLWNDGSVLRPPTGASDLAVVLTVTAVNGSATEKREWNVTIPAYPPEGRSIVSYDPININCPEGNAPKLPNLVKVHYSDGNSELRRIMWEGYSVADQTAQAQHALGDKYTMDGHVQGDNATVNGYKVVANITVVAAEENNKVPSNVPKAETLQLSKVTLNNDPDGEQNRLTLNTENHIKYILGIDVTRMLYNYRWTFGLSTEGYATPGGWDSPTTKLKGHGYGHYLSGLALAYASDTDPDEKGQLLLRMKRMTDEMRQMQEMTFVKIEGEDGQERFREARDRYSTDEEVRGMTNVRLMDDATAPRDPKLFGYGYINAIQPEHLILIENYAPYNGNMGNYGVWAPYYALHKQLAGLVEIYNVLNGGNEEEQAIADKALAISKDMGMWVWNRLHYCTKAGKRPDANSPGYRDTMWGLYIAGEYGGMNETLARLSDIMKGKNQDDADKLLEASMFFDNNGASSDTGNIPFFASLANNIDSIRTLHANQHIPQIVGTLWTFKGSNDPKYYNIAENFWDYIFGRYSFTIGGVGGNNSNEEKFAGTYNQIGVVNDNDGNKICETCAAYNLLKLTKDLNTYNPDNAKYMDYYERLLYNQIVGSIEPGSQANRTSYGYSIYPNTQRSRSTGNATNPGSTCCSGTGTENHVKYQEAAYFTSADNKTFYVGLYMPTTARWDGQDVTITQSCVFPSEESTFTVDVGEKTGDFEMKFRVPYWATKGFDIKLNGKSIADSYEPSSYVSTGVRKWADTDTIIVTMPYGFNVDYLPGKCEGEWYGSLMDGPLVMAATDVKALSRVELDSFLSTGEGTNVIINERKTMTGGVRNEAPTNHVHNMSVQVAPGTSGGEASTKTFIPHYFAGIPAYTTYFFIPAPNENTGVDKTPLFEKITETIGRVDSGLYTDESTAAMQEVLKEALAAYQSEEIMADELEAAISNVDTEVQKMEAKEVDISKLSEKIAEAKAVAEPGYTPESFGKLSSVVTAAEAYVRAANYTNKLTADHIFAIGYAMDSLAELDRKTLETELANAAKLENPENTGQKLWAEHEYTVYTRLSWNAFKTAEASAKKISQNDPKVPTQEEIDQAAAQLKVAMDELLPYNLCDERKPLEDILATAKGYKNDPLVYDTESFANLQKAIEEGEERVGYASLTFPERDGVIDDLEKAIQGLKPIDATEEAIKAAKEAKEAEASAKADAAKAESDAAAAKADADKAAASAATAKADADKAGTEAASAKAEAEKAATEAAAAKANADKAEQEAIKAKENADKAAEDAGKSETAKAAAEDAKAKAETAKANAETARDKALDAQEKAEIAKTKAEEAQTAAESVKAAAEDAKEKALAALTKSEEARDKAEEARTAANKAIAAAEAVNEDAVKARDAAVEAAQAAAAAKGDTQTLKAEVGTLKAEVDTIKEQAAAAKSGAEVAKADAVAAKKEAEAARAGAEAARAEANAAKADALVAKAAAEAAAEIAKVYAEESRKAQEKAEKAALEAEKKEKAAEAARLAAEKAKKKAEAAAKKMEKDFKAFTLSRKAIAVQSAKNAAKGKIKVVAKKNKLAQGYQLQCAVKKNFKGTRRTKTLRNTSYTFGSLKKGIYYVRARAYTKDSKGTRVYSKWSTVKKVRVK